MMEREDKIYIAGHTGLVGSAIVRLLLNKGYHNLLLRTSLQLDLRSQQDVFNFFETEKPDFVILAAATVGGILANATYPANFIFDNLAIEQNIIHASHINGVKKMLFMGSSCIYPKMAPQPIKEEYLLTGLLEPTNDAYAIAKIAGIKMCQAYRQQYGSNFISVMPTNLYGPEDNYHLNNSHVLPALIRKFYEAERAGNEYVKLWGTGTPRREFMHVDDLASACYFLMQNYSEGEIVNIGTGVDHSITEVAEAVKSVSGFKGNIVFDSSKPDGAPRKLLCVEKINRLGWQSSISLEEGINLTYQDFQINYFRYLEERDRRIFTQQKESVIY